MGLLLLGTSEAAMRSSCRMSGVQTDTGPYGVEVCEVLACWAATGSRRGTGASGRCGRTSSAFARAPMLPMSPC